MASEQDKPAEHGHPPHPTGRFDLLGLPAELRNRIYDLVIPDGSTIEVCWTDFYSPAVKTPALMRSCTQIRHECVRMYYERNIFRINSRKSEFPWRFLGTRQLQRCLYMRTLDLSACKHSSRFLRITLGKTVEKLGVELIRDVTSRTGYTSRARYRTPCMMRQITIDDVLQDWKGQQPDETAEFGFWKLWSLLQVLWKTIENAC